MFIFSHASIPRQGQILKIEAIIDLVIGYWMPYSCALAVCATFCSHIGPALIPLFGPSFPSLCVPPEAPEHGRMIIDSAIITAATAKAEYYRTRYTSSITNRLTPPANYPTPTSSTSSTFASSPTLSDKMDIVPKDLAKRLRLNRAFVAESDRDTDAEGSETSGSGDGYFCSPGPAHQPCRFDLASQNTFAHSSNVYINVGTNASPWLSAIPRSTGTFALKASSPPLQLLQEDNWKKRRLEEGEADDEYDSASAGSEKSRSDVTMEDVAEVLEEEKKAAWLLMNLSMGGVEGHRGKKRRANSL